MKPIMGMKVRARLVCIQTSADDDFADNPRDEIIEVSMQGLMHDQAQVQEELAHELKPYVAPPVGARAGSRRKHQLGSLAYEAEMNMARYGEFGVLIGCSVCLPFAAEAERRSGKKSKKEVYMKYGW